MTDMATLRHLLAHVRALDVYRLDVIYGAIVLLEGLAELVFSPLHGTVATVSAVCIGAVAVSVALRRRVPLSAITLAFAAMMVDGMWSEATDHLVGPFFAVMLTVLGAASVTENRRFAAVAATTLAWAVAAALTESTDGGTVDDLVWAICAMAGLPLLLGRLFGGRVRLNLALFDKTQRLERDRGRQAAQAVADERARIAGELHDVIAHALSGMVVQATAARRLVDGDPDRARAAFGAVEQAGREALDEMRRLLGVLRRDDAELALAPQPSLTHLSALLRRADAAGLPVQLHVDGTATPLTPGVDLAAYRVVQEAIDSAVDHGGARSASVEVRYDRNRLSLEIRDDGATPPGGRPLLGVRERVAIHGGELRAEPGRDGGGHAVRAHLPLGSPA